MSDSNNVPLFQSWLIPDQTSGNTTPLTDINTAHFVHIIDGIVHAEDERLSADEGLQLQINEKTTLDLCSNGVALVSQVPLGAEN